MRSRGRLLVGHTENTESHRNGRRKTYPCGMMERMKRRYLCDFCDFCVRWKRDAHGSRKTIVSRRQILFHTEITEITERRFAAWCGEGDEEPAYPQRHILQIRTYTPPKPTSSMSVNRCRRRRPTDVDDVDFEAVEGGKVRKKKSGRGGKGSATDIEEGHRPAGWIKRIERTFSSA